jgi:hypothetical protein
MRATAARRKTAPRSVPTARTMASPHKSPAIAAPAGIRASGIRASLSSQNLFFGGALTSFSATPRLLRRMPRLLPESRTRRVSSPAGPHCEPGAIRDKYLPASDTLSPHGWSRRNPQIASQIASQITSVAGRRGPRSIPAVATAGAKQHLNEPKHDSAWYPDKNRNSEGDHRSEDGGGQVGVPVQEFDPGRRSIWNAWRRNPGITREFGGKLKLRLFGCPPQHIINLLLSGVIKWRLRVLCP